MILTKSFIEAMVAGTAEQFEVKQIKVLGLNESGVVKDNESVNLIILDDTVPKGMCLLEMITCLERSLDRKVNLVTASGLKQNPARRRVYNSLIKDVTGYNQIENDIFCIETMLALTDRALKVHQEIKNIDASTIPPVIYEAAKDGLSYTLSCLGDQLNTSKLSHEIMHQNRDISWAEIIQFRNRHDYWYQDLSHEVAESIADDYLPELYERLLDIKQSLKSSLEEICDMLE